MTNRYFKRYYDRYGNRSDYDYNRSRDRQGHAYGGVYDSDHDYLNNGSEGDYGLNYRARGSNYDRRDYYGNRRSGQSSGRGYLGRNYGYRRDDDDRDYGIYSREGSYGRLPQDRYGRDYNYGREFYQGYGNNDWNQERGWWDRAIDEMSSWFGDEDAERRRRMDEQRAYYKHHRGRGPRGYKRSDDRIREDVNDRLTDHPYLDASDVEVSVDNCEVILSGTVESRYDKRLAEAVADSVSGVTNVQNNLRVNQTSIMTATTGTTGATGMGIGNTTRSI